MRTSESLALWITRWAGNNHAMSESIAEQRTLKSGVAEELRALLGRRRMTSVALARAIGRSHTYVWRRLNAETAFDLDDIERIAATLGISPIDLLRAASESPTLGYPAGDRFGTVGTHVRPRAGRPPSRTDSRRMDDQRTRRRHRPVGR